VTLIAIALFFLGFSIGLWLSCILRISGRPCPEPPSTNDDDSPGGDACWRLTPLGEEATRTSALDPGEIVQDQRRAEAKRKRILNSWPIVPIDPADTIL
jgi:hypothetical protein